jgi:quercetin dioxygenase-like cupin family protein
VGPLKPPKHLVLDEDVHRALKRRKAETGIKVKDLGNCALRTVLERPLLIEAIGERLISAGYLDQKAFDRVRTEVMEGLCSPAQQVVNIVRHTDHNTLETGSWEIEELVRGKDNAYQVLHTWVKDSRLQPMVQHRHEGVQYTIVLTGAALVIIEAEPHMLVAPEVVIVPKQASHCLTPVESSTQLLTVISPPDEGFCFG